MKLLISSAEPNTKCLGSGLGSYFSGYNFSGHLTFKCQCEVIEITMSADRLLINGLINGWNILKLQHLAETDQYNNDNY